MTPLRYVAEVASWIAVWAFVACWVVAALMAWQVLT